MREGNSREFEELERKAEPAKKLLISLSGLKRKICREMKLNDVTIKEFVKKGKIPVKDSFYERLKKFFPSYSESITALQMLSKEIRSKKKSEKQ